MRIRVTLMWSATALVVTLGLLLAGGEARGGTPISGERECGNVTAKARNLRTFGYSGHHALPCWKGKKVTRRWIARKCGRTPGDVCRFKLLGKRWHCTVGTVKKKRVVGCNDQKAVGLSFLWRP
jgi:hypothetical protein